MRMSLVKGTVWNIATLVIGLKIFLATYNIELFGDWSIRWVGIFLIIVSAWFLVSRLAFGPKG